MFWATLTTAWAVPVDPATVEQALAATAAFRSRRLAVDTPSVTAEVVRQAAQGGQVVTGMVAVPGHAARIGWGVGAVEVGIGRLAAALSDDASKPRVSSLSEVGLLGGSWCGDRRRVFQYLPMSVVSDRWWVVDQVFNVGLADASRGAMMEATWQSVDDPLPEPWATRAQRGVRVAFTRGSWLLVRLDAQRTWVEYTGWSDPGGQVPASIASRFAASGIPDAIDGMVRLAQRGPGCPDR